jgi:hypothetical protein
MGSNGAAQTPRQARSREDRVEGEQLRRPVFSVGERIYDIADVVIAAVLRGEWSALERQLQHGLACVRRGEGALEEAHRRRLEEAAQAFRYSRNLLAAEELEGWLERVGLSSGEWIDYLKRSVLRRLHSSEVASLVDEASSGEDVISRNIYAEALCSGELQRFALELGGRAALYDCALEEDALQRFDPSDADLAQAHQACSAAAAPPGLKALPGEELAARVAESLRLETCFQGRTTAAVTATAVRAQIAVHVVEWTSVDWQYLEVAEESIAREAALCLREDGTPLAEVAARARVPVCRETVLLERVDPESRAALLAARAGDVLGLLALPSGFRVARVSAKTPPTERDESVRRRAEEQVVADLIDREQRRRVSWHTRL